MRATFSGIQIRGVTAVFPDNKLELASLSEKFGESEVKRVIANTGIKTVRVAKPTQKISDLCAAACNHLFKKLQIDRDSIDAIVLVTQTPG